MWSGHSPLSAWLCACAPCGHPVCSNTARSPLALYANRRWTLRPSCEKIHLPVLTTLITFTRKQPVRFKQLTAGSLSVRVRPPRTLGLARVGDRTAGSCEFGRGARGLPGYRTSNEPTAKAVSLMAHGHARTLAPHAMQDAQTMQTDEGDDTRYTPHGTVGRDFPLLPPIPPRVYVVHHTG